MLEKTVFLLSSYNQQKLSVLARMQHHVPYQQASHRHVTFFSWLGSAIHCNLSM